MAKVIISGGTGMIGRTLAGKLASKGYDVKILTRNVKKVSAYESVYWNPEKDEIDKEKVIDCNYVIHLAGENIAKKRWTKKQKKKIIESRTKSTELLYKTFFENGSKPEAFISASAVGFYGTETSAKVFKETDSAGNDFLAKVCKAWESGARLFDATDMRRVVFRIGVVLSENGGALKKLTLPLKFGIIAGTGNGRQILPWIHAEDLAEMFLFAMENGNMHGTYNAVAPFPVTFNEFVDAVLKVKRGIKTPNVPAFLLRMFLGEMSAIILEGSAVSADKIMSEGFNFRFPRIEEALKDLLE